MVFFKGVDFALKVLRWDGDTVVRLQLWDIAGLFVLWVFVTSIIICIITGQERFGSSKFIS